MTHFTPVDSNDGSSDRSAARRPRAGGPDPPTDAPPVRLRSTLVRYPVSSDRRTIYPPGLPDVERMTTWLTADADAFVPLERVR